MLDNSFCLAIWKGRGHYGSELHGYLIRFDTRIQLFDFPVEIREHLVVGIQADC
jgi:hypothetical protein